jgi:serine/threonine-protein kinase
MVLQGARAKIMDFGIARTRASEVKTQTGAVIGTPRYMSPEQVNGERVDHRSDIFSLGVTLYEMLTGDAPFSAPDLGQLLYQVASASPVPPSSLDPRVPPMMDLILAKALEKAPERRYQNAGELAADLRACKAQIEQSGLLEKTVLSDASCKTNATENAARSEKPAATTAASGLCFVLSRRFDSTDAVKRLGLPAARTSGAGAWAALTRVLRDPAQRAAGIGILATTLAALLIGFA